MGARILDGRAIAADVLAGVADRVQALADGGIEPHLVFVTLGESAPALMYLGRLQKLARRVGIAMSRRALPHDVTLDHLDSEVAALNNDELVDGILVQMPLPEHLTVADLAVIIDARKDVDGLTVQNAGRLYLGLPGQTPSTALAMMHILTVSGVDPLGLHAVIVGRSSVVGHPVTELLLQSDATVTVTHRQTRDLGSFTSQGDILMVAAGEPHLISAEMVKPGAVIIDAGINPTETGVVGDVDFEAARHIAAAMTPVPGGVGPVTNAVLLRNLVDSAEQRCG
ncbi:MAG TPA: bifunctional 5,10-methylenetetrahydrofolate dehydrogenase/5,10-methenyltetrahydrofolate cyclohydrolase [Chloroflexota bacterium]